MQPKAKKLLFDMLEATREIKKFVAGKSLYDMKNDSLLRSAIYYQFTIIGEALSQLREADEPMMDRISEAKRIVGFRNQIIHGYSKIDHEVTWRIISTKLDILIQELTDLLEE